MHFRVNERRRSAKDLGFAAFLGEAQGMYSIDGPDASVPEPVTFAFDRGAEIVGVGVGSHERGSMPMPMPTFKFKFLSGIRPVRVGGGPDASAIVSGIAAILIVSRLLTCAF